MFGLCSTFCYKFVRRDVCLGWGSGWHTGPGAGSFATRMGQGRGLPCTQWHVELGCSVPGPQENSGGEAVSSKVCGVGMLRAVIYTQMARSGDRSMLGGRSRELRAEPV